MESRSWWAAARSIRRFGDLHAPIFRDDRRRVAVGQCLDILAQQQQNKYFPQVLPRCGKTSKRVLTLAAAMSRHPRVFDQLYSNMVEAGETGGILDLILQRLFNVLSKAR